MCCQSQAVVVLVVWCRVQTQAGLIQMATLRTHDYRVRSPMVLAKRTTAVWRWVQRYEPELHLRRRELKPTNGSWRVDETYIRVAGAWSYLYRAVDSTVATIDFWFSAQRDAAAAKRSSSVL
jgi:hypothetical protein